MSLHYIKKQCFCVCIFIQRRTVFEAAQAVKALTWFDALIVSFWFINVIVDILWKAKLALVHVSGQ